MIIKIIKDKNCPFVRIDNRIFTDQRLSFKAKGVLGYLLSRPDDWVVRTSDLAKRSTDGTASIRSAMKELRRCGYASLEIIRGEGGRVDGSSWVIFEEAVTAMQEDQDPGSHVLGKSAAPVTENAVFRHSVNPTLGSTENAVFRHSVNPTLGKPLPLVTNDKIQQTKDSAAGAAPTSFGMIGGETAKKTPSTKLCEIFHKKIISHRYHIGKKRPSFQKWKMSCDDLIESLGGDWKKVRTVMRWYWDHHKDPWVGTYHSMITFCENFHKIDKAMRRDQKETQVPERPKWHMETVLVDGQPVEITTWDTP
jgi:hypothetical protein